MSDRTGFAVLFVLFLLLWLLLTGFTHEEVLAGAFASLIGAAASHRFFSFKGNYVRSVFYLLIYIPCFVWQEILAHLEVIKSILTGKIKPAIVKIPHTRTSDFGKTFLANSITLTPGTLTLDIDEKDLVVHWLSVKKDKKEITKRFEEVLGRVWD